MPRTRKTHSSKFKAQVALEAVKWFLTTAEISAKYGIHPTQIGKWKQAFMQNMDQVFLKNDAHKQEIKEKDYLIEELYKKVGKHQVELDWLKKKVDNLPP